MTDRYQTFRLADITVGAAWVDLPNITINTPTEVPEADINARLEFRTKPDGALIVALDTAPDTGEGTITVTSLGGEADKWEYELALHLPDEITADLEPKTDEVAGATQYAGVGHLAVWTATVLGGDRQITHRYVMTIDAEVTV